MEGEKKKRRGRRAYLEDFQPTAAGGHVYTGEFYTFQAGRLTYRRFMACAWLLGLVMAALAVAGGVIPVEGMFNTVYVILPYICALFSVVSVLWALGRISHWGDPLRAYIYKATVEQLPLRAVLSAVFAGCTLAGEAVFLVLNGTGNGHLGYSILFLALQLALAGAAILLRRFIKSQRWSK